MKQKRSFKRSAILSLIAVTIILPIINVIPESVPFGLTLILCAVLGGTIGYFGDKVFNYFDKKRDTHKK